MRTLCVLALLLIGALSGCASMEDRATSSKEMRSRTVVDEVRVARVNRAARERGVEVIWVHLPKKQEAVASNQ
jgi:uncharacterized protein YceK